MPSARAFAYLTRYPGFIPQHCNKQTKLNQTASVLEGFVFRAQGGHLSILFFWGSKRYIGRITCHREAVQQLGGGLRKVQADLMEDLAERGPLEKGGGLCHAVDEWVTVQTSSQAVSESAMRTRKEENLRDRGWSGMNSEFQASEDDLVRLS